MVNQPFLSGRSALVAAPLQTWSQLDGQADASAPYGTIDGVHCGDERVLSAIVLRCTSHEMEHVNTSEPGGGTAAYGYVLRTPELGVDPALVITRHREVTATTVRERLVLTTAATSEQAVELRATLRADATSMMALKGGEQGPAADVPVANDAEELTWGWRDEGTRCRLTVQGGTLHSSADGVAELSWAVPVAARGMAEVGWTLEVSDASLPFVADDSAPLVAPTSGDPRLRRLLETSFRDINGLRMRRPGSTDPFLAAGAPWYFTLFGRDSLIAARNLVTHDASIAIGTLRTLAALQGRTIDRESAEQPGKILHEVRKQTLELDVSHQGQDPAGSAISLPPIYYGTIDATPLWVMLLADVAATGRTDVAAELAEPLRAALGWLLDHADADGDAFLEYVDETGHGLANQGWKDSGDSVRFADGSLASAPVALCEVQGYAHAALVLGADLVDGLAGSDDAALATRCREQASVLADRFRESFWTRDELGRYPVLALDGAQQQVDGVASNMGHLLGTGILTHDEAATVVRRLMDPTMRSGHGIRTLSTTNAGYWPLGYHVGSVWAHDTAFIVDGMLREGFVDEAAELASELLRAAEGFGMRLPELFSGLPADEAFPPQPYPASCHPQAWAATSSVVIARALDGHSTD